MMYRSTQTVVGADEDRMVTYSWAGATDVGRTKDENQDAVLPDDIGMGPGPVIVAVADGLGGHPGGADASRLALQALSSAGPVHSAVELVEAAQLVIKRHIIDAVDDDPTLLMMATTLTLAVLHPEGSVSIGHVGDSRAYLGDGTVFMQVTDDHTVAMEKVRSGELAEHDAERDPGWHVMSNWLGWEECRVENRELRVESGDRLLLCSDGMSNMVDDDRIAELLFSGTPDETATALIAAANDGGGADNIAVVVAEVSR